MLHFQCAPSKLLFAASLVISLQAGSLAAQPGQVPIPSNLVQTSKTDAHEFGVGWTLEKDQDSAGAVLEGRVYDSKGTLREKEEDKYSTDSGAKLKTEKRLWDFNENGKLTLGVDYKYDLRGDFKFIDTTHYGFHGERTWEQITDYQPTGIATEEWKSATDKWTNGFTQYKLDTPKPGATVAPPVSLLPTITNVGVLFPRSFRPGDTITGSLCAAKYAESFKGVPGFSEYSFPTQMYHLPDGSPEWPWLSMGLRGDGYTPVNPNGTFTLHIPMDFKGSMELQTRQQDPISGLGQPDALLELGDPVAALEIPKNLFSKTANADLQYAMTEDLIDYWNEAFDLENEIDDFYEGYGPADVDIGQLEEDLDDVYDDIDGLTARLPTEVVVKLARGMAEETREINEQIRKGPLTADQKVELTEYDHWASFLEDEAGEATSIRLSSAFRPVEPFWTLPVLSQNKLGALRGSFSGDANDTLLKIGDYPVQPLCSTPDTLYFMPPMSLTAGLHNYLIDSPGIAETTLPVFYMTVTMWADQLNLRKGQSTTYHVKLDGLNGLPGGAWNAPFFPSDLVSPAEWNAQTPNAQSPGSSLTGSITLAVTNQSPGTISMANTFSILDAKFFAPSGTYQIDGGVGAITDGTFSIQGVARAYLQPELGLGTPTGTPSAPIYAPQPTRWTPIGGWSAAPSASALGTTPSNCSIGSMDGLQCMGNETTRLYDDAVGNGHTATVGNPSAQDTLDAAKKTVKEAQEIEQKKFNESFTDNLIREEAWKKGAEGAPKEDYDNYLKDKDRAYEAHRRCNEAKVHQDLFPSPAREKAVQDTTTDCEDLDKAVKKSHEALIKEFTKEDRANYDIADWTAKEAKKDLAKAKARLFDAQEDLKAAEKAMSAPAPTTPPAPVGPASPGAPAPATPKTPATPDTPGAPAVPATPAPPGTPATPTPPTTPPAPGDTEPRIPIG